MARDNADKAIAGTGIMIFLIFIFLGRMLGVSEFFNDSVVFIMLVIFFYLTYDNWNLTTPLFAFLILSFVPHNMGIFGYYSASPIPLQWDHFTHFLPMMALSMVFFRFFQRYMGDDRLKTFILVFAALSAALGIGTFIEKAEFIGFLVNGFGEGGFAFGAGDACAGQTATAVEEIDAFGGGWFNTMYDLMWNFYGALSGILLMAARKFLGFR